MVRTPWPQARRPQPTKGEVTPKSAEGPPTKGEVTPKSAERPQTSPTKRIVDTNATADVTNETHSQHKRDLFFCRTSSSLEGGCYNNAQLFSIFRFFRFFDFFVFRFSLKSLLFSSFFLPNRYFCVSRPNDGQKAKFHG